MSRIWFILVAIAAAVLVLTYNTNNAENSGFAAISNDRLASLLFLGILGTAIIAGSLSNVKEGLGTWRKLFRDAMLWVLIILLLMVGYTYRYQLQDFGATLTAGIIPGSPISSTSSQGKEQVTLIKDRSGQYRAKLSVDRNVIEFLIDTGASAIVLSNKDAIAAGVNSKKLRFNVLVSTANGETRAARYRFNEFILGGIKRKNVAVLIADKGDLDVSLLGMTFLGTLSGFQITGDRLILTD